MSPELETPFLRAIHYFGTAQPGNFWDAADLRDAPAHLRQIRADGFNCIVIVVPWRGFQPSLRPPRMDPISLERLGQLLRMTDQAGLLSILRVSFPWNFDPDSELDFDQRGLGLFNCSVIRQAWLAYLAELKRTCDSSYGFQFAFFSWEDLPSIRELMVHRSPQDRLLLAESTGFRDFLLADHDLAQLSVLYGVELSDPSQVFIPLPDCRAYEHFNLFVNQKFADLLEFGRTVWPKLSMQIRADYQHLCIDGQSEWLQNDVRENDPQLRVTYYFPYMYAQNQGETLSAAQALANLNLVMQRVSANGSNPNHFLDQLVYWDESPQFSNWAKIDASQQGQFLCGAVDLLRPLSKGYGLWNYFDYRVNHFYNPNFLRQLHGWECSGELGLVELDQRRAAVLLAPGSSICQSMIPDLRGNATWLYEQMQFSASVQAQNGALLRLFTDEELEAEVAVNGSEDLTLSFSAQRHRGAQSVCFKISNVGTAPLAITNLTLWGFVFRSRIYDEYGQPGRFHAQVLAMNRQ